MIHDSFTELDWYTWYVNESSMVALIRFYSARESIHMSIVISPDNTKVKSTGFSTGLQTDTLANQASVGQSGFSNAG